MPVEAAPIHQDEAIVDLCVGGQPAEQGQEVQPKAPVGGWAVEQDVPIEAAPAYQDEALVDLCDGAQLAEQGQKVQPDALADGWAVKQDVSIEAASALQDEALHDLDAEDEVEEEEVVANTAVAIAEGIEGLMKTPPWPQNGIVRHWRYRTIHVKCGDLEACKTACGLTFLPSDGL